MKACLLEPPQDNGQPAGWCKFNIKSIKKMKKFLMTIAAVFVAMNMSAQVYVGGSVGVASVTDNLNESQTVYKFVPEIGYNLNDDWAVGVELGYQKGACNLGNGAFGQDTDTEVFSIAPYARYTFVKSKLINLFVDGGVGIGSYKDLGTQFLLGFKPGVAVNLSESLSFVAHVGFVGMESFNWKQDGIDNSTNVGVSLDNNNLTFGLYYNF